MELADRIRSVLQLGGDSWSVEFEGETFSWAQVEALADAICAALHTGGVRQHDVVGWVAENLPGAIAGKAGLAMHGHCCALINPHLPPRSTPGRSANSAFRPLLAAAISGRSRA